MRVLAAAALLLLAAGCGGRSPQAGASPAATVAESPGAAVGGVMSVPSVDPGAFASPSPSSATAAAAPAAAAPAPGASASPSADPEAAKRAEQEQKLRAQVDAAKAKADALTAQYNSECPELKPGELRHPGAVAACNRLHEQAGAAIQAYQTARQEAQAAGVNVQ